MMNGPAMLTADFMEKTLGMEKLEYPKMPSPSGDILSPMHSPPVSDGQMSPPTPNPNPQNHVSSVSLHGISIVSLVIDNKERLCLAQISNTLLKDFSYNEIHNRRVALGITCVQCTPVQLEILRRAGAMPISSRRCGMITKREAERLVKSFLEDTAPPQLPENFAFRVRHECGWGCAGSFMPSRYNSSRAKCIKCTACELFFSPNKFIFHFHRTSASKYHHPDAANFNSWRRHLMLDYDKPSEELVHAWEDVKAMFNGGSRKRLVPTTSRENANNHNREPENKRSRPPMTDTSAPLGKIPGLGLTYPYPVLPLNSPACPNVTGYMARPPHPAFPFPAVDPAAMNDTSKMASNLVDMWKAKSVNPYCNPFGLLWAKNFGLYTDPSAPYRQIMDLSQNSHMSNRMNSRGINSQSKHSSREHSGPHKDDFWQAPKSHSTNPTENYFSAFKPVARDGSNPFENPLPSLSVERDDSERVWSERVSSLDEAERSWSDRAHSVTSEASPLSDCAASLPEAEADLDETDINVTDVDNSEHGDHGSKPKSGTLLHDVPSMVHSGPQESTQASQNRLNMREMTEVKQNNEEICSADGLLDVKNSASTSKPQGIYSLSKEELQRELERLMEERNRAEKDYDQLKDSFNKKSSDDPSFRAEMENEFAIVKEAHDALRQFSTKMMALRESVDVVKPVQ